MNDLHLDFETYSELDLTEVGLMRYLRHPSTRVLLAAWHYHGEMKQATYEDGFVDLWRDIADADRVHAWNASFEWGVMRSVLGWDVPLLEKMHCTMAHALYRAFPASLDKAARALGLPGKLDDGRRLITVFCGGRGKARPGDWEKFCTYNRLDVEAEMAVARALEPHPWPEAEHEVWVMSERINWRGVPVDLVSVNNAVSVHEELQDRAVRQIEDLTGVSNGRSVQQLIKWLGTRGVHTRSLDKDHLPALIQGASGDVREVLVLRQRIALTAPQKYTVAKEQNWEGRLCNMLQYSGAGRTHRWSGRGLQPQNIRRGWKDDDKIAEAWQVVGAGADAAAATFEDPFLALADMVRSIIRDPRGRDLVVADYSSIEVVMLHWAAGDKPMLDKIRDGLDPYKVFASWHFGVPYEQVRKDQRTFAKPVVLGCGYGLGKATLVEYAAGMGVVMTEDQAAAAVYGYREHNHRVVALWYGLQEAMTRTISTGRPHAYGHFQFSMRGKACILHLPAGTEITYWDARLDGDRIHYWGVNQYTGQWDELSTWGGKLVENAVQSISRDVLVYGLRRAIEAGVDVFLHVHDEIVAPKDDEGTLETLLAAMTAPPWCADAPIHAAGFTCPRYRKD